MIKAIKAAESPYPVLADIFNMPQSTILLTEWDRIVEVMNHKVTNIWLENIEGTV